MITEGSTSYNSLTDMAASKDTKKDQESTLAEKKTYEFDDLLELVGGFGRYTACLYAFMCVLSVPTGAQNLIQVFYGATPDFQCAQPTILISNNTCGLSQCCSNCSGYRFKETFTSAVTEVSKCLLAYHTSLITFNRSQIKRPN